MSKFCQCLTELSAHDTIMAGFYSLTFLFILTVPDSGDFCCLLITFANSLDPDQA